MSSDVNRTGTSQLALYFIKSAPLLTMHGLSELAEIKKNTNTPIQLLSIILKLQVQRIIVFKKIIRNNTEKP